MYIMTTTIPVKVYNVQNKPKFMIENDMMPEIFGVGTTYIFDLSHVSNFQTHMSISKYAGMAMESDEVVHVGEPGMRGSQLVFTPKSIGNRYIYDKVYGVLMGSLLNPMILLKNIHLYDGITALEEFAKVQLYEFSVNEDPVHVARFIQELRYRSTGLSPEELASCNYPCKRPEQDGNINRNIVSTARRLTREFPYIRKQVNRANLELNVFGRVAGGPGGLGAAPRNSFV